MKKTIFFVIIVALAVIIGVYIGNDKGAEQFRIVKLSGGDAYVNFTKSDFSWIAGPDKDSLSALPVINGDLIYMFTDDDKLPLYRYDVNDGDYLKFRWEDFKLFLNDKIIAAEITESQDVLTWLNNPGATEIKHLQYIAVSDDISAETLSGLKNLADVKPDIGFFFLDDTPAARDILKLFKPIWLAAPDCKFDSNEIKIITNLKNLKLLYIDASNWEPAGISKLNNLEALVLTNMTQPDSNKYIVNKNLKSVSILESEITNITFLSKLTEIVELNLLNCSEVTSISSIENLAGLKRLSLINCENLSDISVLNTISPLKWLSFNPGITVEEADQLAGYHKDIEVMELINCRNIKDAASLKQLKNLSCLSVYNTDLDFNTIDYLKGLRYLSVPDSIFSDSLQLAQIREKIPNCIIVPSNGLCLGSGWLLLLIPVLVICGIVLKFFNRTGN